MLCNSDSPTAIRNVPPCLTLLAPPRPASRVTAKTAATRPAKETARPRRLLFPAGPSHRTIRPEPKLDLLPPLSSDVLDTWLDFLGPPLPDPACGAGDIGDDQPWTAWQGWQGFAFARVRSTVRFRQAGGHWFEPSAAHIFPRKTVISVA